jgi:hypothetical protein
MCYKNLVKKSVLLVQKDSLRHCCWVYKGVILISFEQRLTPEAFPLWGFRE